ncbi:metallophosphoesterase [Akkermansia massiliensis]
MIGFSLFMWAWQVEPRRVETVTTALEVPQWKEKGGSPLRIVIAGDFHLRPNGGDQARRYMEKIMEAQPDMIFLLGDYANGHTRESSMSPETAREYFKMLKAPWASSPYRATMTSTTAGTCGGTCFQSWASCPCGTIPCCCTSPEAEICSFPPFGTTTT